MGTNAADAQGDEAEDYETSKEGEWRWCRDAMRTASSGKRRGGEGDGRTFM